MSVLLKRLQVRRSLIVHRPAMIPLPAVHRPLPVRCPVKPATAQPVGSGGGSEGGWYEYFRKQYKKREFEMAIASVFYAVILAWRSNVSSEQQEEKTMKALEVSQKALEVSQKALETSQKALEVSQKLDERTLKILEVCEGLEAKSSTKHSSFFGRFASAFWWDKTEKGKAGGGESGKGEDDRM